LTAGLAGVLAGAAFLIGLAACLTGFGAGFFTGLAAAFLGAGLAGAFLMGFLAAGLPFPPLLAGAAFLVGVLFFLLTI
jgi:hypothetical protein